MSFKKRDGRLCTLLSICVVSAGITAGGVRASAQVKSDQPKSAEIEFITAEELKAKVARNEPVTIIDVRATNAYLDSKNKIKGAIHVKLRRLKTRLAFPPLKDLPREREIVTYCACPSDEASIRAAQILLAAGFKQARALKGGWQQSLPEDIGTRFGNKVTSPIMALTNHQRG